MCVGTNTRDVIRKQTQAHNRSRLRLPRSSELGSVDKNATEGAGGVLFPPCPVANSGLGIYINKLRDRRRSALGEASVE